MQFVSKYIGPNVLQRDSHAPIPPVQKASSHANEQKALQVVTMALVPDLAI
jgi:hypothetical protein